jgi:hypothetical protein
MQHLYKISYELQVTKSFYPNANDDHHPLAIKIPLPPHPIVVDDYPVCGTTGTVTVTPMQMGLSLVLVMLWVNCLTNTIIYFDSFKIILICNCF